MIRYTEKDLRANIGQSPSALKATPPRKRSREESQMQIALMKWWHMQHRAFGVPEILLLSIPNGGARTAITGAILKAEGARKGAPDLLLAVAKQRYVGLSAHEPEQPGITWCHGLFLELKRRDGVLSKEQEIFHELLRRQGYKVCVVWSLQEAINEITSYLTK